MNRKQMIDALVDVETHFLEIEGLLAAFEGVDDAPAWVFTFSRMVERLKGCCERVDTCARVLVPLEQSSDCPAPAPEKAKPQSWDRDNCGFGASVHNSGQGVSHGMA